MKNMDRHSAKFTFREILIISFAWLMAFALIYIIYLKITIFAHWR